MLINGRSKSDLSQLTFPDVMVLQWLWILFHLSNPPVTPVAPLKGRFGDPDPAAGEAAKGALPGRAPGGSN